MRFYEIMMIKESFATKAENLIYITPDALLAKQIETTTCILV